MLGSSSSGSYGWRCGGWGQHSPLVPSGSSESSQDPLLPPKTFRAPLPQGPPLKHQNNPRTLRSLPWDPCPCAPGPSAPRTPLPTLTVPSTTFRVLPGCSDQLSDPHSPPQDPQPPQALPQTLLKAPRFHPRPSEPLPAPSVPFHPSSSSPEHPPASLGLPAGPSEPFPRTPRRTFRAPP